MERMRDKTLPLTAAARLRASPAFSLNFAMDGRPYVAKDVEPYTQFWLAERERVLLSMFSSRRGATVEEAIDAYLRLTGKSAGARGRALLRKAARDMHAAGVLVGPDDDTSRYSRSIVEAYIAHRPFPRELSDHIISRAPVARHSRVLDLAGGPGDLALALAEVSDHVALMDLSKGFVAAAAQRAGKSGLKLGAIHDSANRLVFRDEQYDVVTISQALHWLDDVLVCKGLCRVLRPGGSFFVIQGGFEVGERHPLAYILGRNSILGHKAEQSFAKGVRALARRLALLFEALDAPDVQRVDPTQQWSDPGTGADGPIVAAGVSLFRQPRPMGPGFVRAFLTPRHIEVTGQAPAAFWKDVESRCAGATADQLSGVYEWGILHFRKGGAAASPQALAPGKAVGISYQAPPAGKPSMRRH
jgi:2-polyprenyl-3-methyl-5-hydroxy-6-metoxy-1,4-benzoquinol methylase